MLPEFDYENDIDLNDSYIQSAPLTIMEDENDNQESLSERLYKEIDGQTTRMFLFNDTIYHLFLSFRSITN